MNTKCNTMDQMGYMAQTTMINTYDQVIAAATTALSKICGFMSVKPPTGWASATPLG